MLTVDILGLETPQPTLKKKDGRGRPRKQPSKIDYLPTDIEERHERSLLIS